MAFSFFPLPPATAAPEQVGTCTKAWGAALQAYRGQMPGSLALTACSNESGSCGAAAAATPAAAAGGLPHIPDLSADAAAVEAKGGFALLLWQFLAGAREQRARLAAALEAAAAAEAALRRALCAAPEQELADLFAILFRFVASLDADYKAFFEVDFPPAAKPPAPRRGGRQK